VPETARQRGDLRRKVALGMQVSLDGYVATSDGGLDWAFGNFDDELNASVLEILSRLDAILLGRANYEEQAATWPNSEGPFADVMNKVEKIVFSKTLDKVEWSNSRLATSSPAEEIAQLKNQPGRDIGVAGGARFAQYLSKESLIDEYRLAIHPVALGSGMPLFADPINLELLSSKTFATGVVINTYKPASKG
jgi:dihydrofolate reductase